MIRSATKQMVQAVETNMEMIKGMLTKMGIKRQSLMLTRLGLTLVALTVFKQIQETHQYMRRDTMG